MIINDHHLLYIYISSILNVKLLGLNCLWVFFSLCFSLRPTFCFLSFNFILLPIRALVAISRDRSRMHTTLEKKIQTKKNKQSTSSLTKMQMLCEPNDLCEPHNQREIFKSLASNSKFVAKTNSQNRQTLVLGIVNE